MALALSVVGGAAGAHDTWFESRGQRGQSDRFISLGTGNAFPIFDSPVGTEHLRRHGCREGGKDVALRSVAMTSKSLLLKAQISGTAAASCWAQLAPAEIELPSDLIPVYFAEAQPPESVRAAWAAMERRGRPWKERYTKHARIVFGSATLEDPATGPAEPGDMGMDMMMVGDGASVRAGDVVTVRVLRDGQPLGELAVELRHVPDGVSVSTGAWHKTDDQGQVRLVVPQAGRWLLRGIDIRKSDRVADSWDTRFATLAFDVAPRDTR